MAFDQNIPAIETYNVEMHKSMLDKIFFIDKVDATVFVDVGCSDGTLIKYLKAFFPDYIYIGFDISQKQLDIARENVPGVLFTDSWYIIEEELRKNSSKKSALILSSVIHEVYSYQSKEDVEKFWSQVWGSEFNYIIIRDMMVSRSTSRPSDQLSMIKIRQNYDPNKIAEWESIWGGLHENWSMIHFLLTYRYQENWAREVRENYLPMNVEDFLHIIPKNFSATYYDHYTLPFLRDQVQKDFGIHIGDRTHIKLILERTS